MGGDHILIHGRPRPHTTRERAPRLGPAIPALPTRGAGPAIAPAPDASVWVTPAYRQVCPGRRGGGAWRAGAGRARGGLVRPPSAYRPCALAAAWASERGNGSRTRGAGRGGRVARAQLTGRRSRNLLAPPASRACARAPAAPPGDPSGRRSFRRRRERNWKGGRLGPRRWSRGNRAVPRLLEAGVTERGGPAPLPGARGLASGRPLGWKGTREESDLRTLGCVLQRPGVNCCRLRC